MSTLLLIGTLIVLIVVHEFGHFIVAKLLKIRVEEFGVGYPPRAFKIGTWGGTEYTVNWLPFGGFVRLLEEDGPDEPGKTRRAGSFASAPKSTQAFVLLAGVGANALFGWMLFVGGFMTGMPVIVDQETPGARLVVTTVVLGSPAEHVGLQAGDEVRSVIASNGGVASLTPEKVVEFVSTRGGKDITITYVRKEESKTTTIVPAHGILPDRPGQAALGMGLALVAEQKLPLHTAMIKAFEHTFLALKNVLFGLGRLAGDAIFGQADIRVLVGPVGLVGAVGDAAAHGLGQFFGLAALISVNLVVINLLPVPALDGGRLLFVGLEAIRRKKMPIVAAQIMNALGFALIIGLMLAVTYNDIIRIAQ